MRKPGLVLLIIALAACGQTAEPPSNPAPTPEAAAPEAPAIAGRFTAISNTAMSITGDLDATADMLSFAKGFRIEGGRIDSMLTPNTDLSAGGGTIADGSGNMQIQIIELRRIETLRVAADARDPQLCGEGKTASYAILANGGETLSLLVFSGAEAPGPNAHDSQLCGIFNYAPA